MITQSIRQELVRMYNYGEHREYPDPLDFLRILESHPGVPAATDFLEFRKAYAWLYETRRQNHSNGKHSFVGAEELARSAGVSPDALAAAAIELGFKQRSHGATAAFKFPPLKKQR
jgi:hypothetical protein